MSVEQQLEDTFMKEIRSSSRNFIDDIKQGMCIAIEYCHFVENEDMACLQLKVRLIIGEKEKQSTTSPIDFDINESVELYDKFMASIDQSVEYLLTIHTLEHMIENRPSGKYLQMVSGSAQLFQGVHDFLQEVKKI